LYSCGDYGGSCFNDQRAGAGGDVAPGVGVDVVDGAGRDLCGVDDDVAHERAVVANTTTLVVGNDRAEVGVVSPIVIVAGLLP
jgi:hypothetical protein